MWNAKVFRMLCVPTASSPNWIAASCKTLYAVRLSIGLFAPLRDLMRYSSGPRSLQYDLMALRQSWVEGDTTYLTSLLFHDVQSIAILDVSDAQPKDIGDAAAAVHPDEEHEPIPVIPGLQPLINLTDKRRIPDGILLRSHHHLLSWHAKGPAVSGGPLALLLSISNHNRIPPVKGPKRAKTGQNGLKRAN